VKWKSVLKTFPKKCYLRKKEKEKKRHNNNKNKNKKKILKKRILKNKRQMF